MLESVVSDTAMASSRNQECTAGPEGCKCLLVASGVYVCVCVWGICVCIHAHTCVQVCVVVYVDRGLSVCVLCLWMHGWIGACVYALPPMFQFRKALITQSSTELFLHGPGGWTVSLGGPCRCERPHRPLLLLLLPLASSRTSARLLALLPGQVPVGILPPALASLPPLLPLRTWHPPHCAPPGLLGVRAGSMVPSRGIENPACPLLGAPPETTELLLLGAGPPWGPFAHFTLRRTTALHGAIGS